MRRHSSIRGGSVNLRYLPMSSQVDSRAVVPGGKRTSQKSTIMPFIVVMYRHTKKSVTGYVQYNVTPLISSSLHRFKIIHVLPLILVSSISHKSIRSRFYPIPRSMMSTSIASVSNELESANNLAHSKEP
jgi:hypothetical protein